MLAFMLPLGVIGPTQILVIVILIIVLFGGKKIPELMRGHGTRRERVQRRGQQRLHG